MSMKYEDCFHSQWELLSKERRTSYPTCIVVLIVEFAMCMLHVLYFPAHKTHRDFSLEIKKKIMMNVF
jgi:hypothetical protein